jgi:hypothetical protein
MSRLYSILVAVALVLALPSVSLAASSTATETLTVQSQVTITGVPASIAYGSGLGGTTLSSSPMSIVVTTNNPTGLTFSAAATKLTGSTWGGNIAVTNRSFTVNGGAPIAYTVAESAKQTLKTFATATDATAGAMTVVSRVAIPASAAPDSYAGSVTFHADVNP